MHQPKDTKQEQLPLDGTGTNCTGPLTSSVLNKHVLQSHANGDTEPRTPRVACTVTRTFLTAAGMEAGASNLYIVQGSTVYPFKNRDRLEVNI